MAARMSNVVRIALLVLGLGALAVLAGCSTAETGAAESDDLATATPNEPTVLRFYNWDTYMDPEILADFERTHGVTIEYSVYDNDGDLLEELQEGATDQYDLIVPSDFIVAIMRDEELLAPLNKENIPNFDNLDTAFVSPVFDPANRYCAPYQWGTVGIGYHPGRTGREINSWSDFFSPEFSGRAAMLDDFRTALGIALLIQGYSPNTTDPRQIAQAAEYLKQQADQIDFVGDEAQDLLLEGQYDLVVEWSGDVFQVMEEDPKIRYVIPEEGSIIWTDNICIPADAPNKELAERFINYLLEPEIGARLSNYIQYGSPNEAALPFINADDLANPALYPSPSVSERLFFLVDVDLAATAIYEQAWNEVLAAQDQ